MMRRKMMSAFFLVDWEGQSLSYLAKMKADFVFDAACHTSSSNRTA